MSALQTGREALLAEALGDVADLLDRGEAVAATMRSAAEDLTNACTRLEAQAAAAEPRMIRLAEHTQSVAAKHIARSSHELMHEAADAECRSMASFARMLFHSELRPALESLTHAAKTCAASRSQAHINWWACAISAGASAIMTGAMTFYLLLT